MVKVNVITPITKRRSSRIKNEYCPVWNRRGHRDCNCLNMKIILAGESDVQQKGRSKRKQSLKKKIDNDSKKQVIHLNPKKLWQLRYVKEAFKKERKAIEKYCKKNLKKNSKAIKKHSQEIAIKKLKRKLNRLKISWN